MEIRKSHLDDVQRIMTLIHQAQNYFKQQNIDQWQDGYSQSLDIIEDIQKNNSYVIEDHDIIGTMYFAIEDEPTYQKIQGQWLTHHKPYAVIHRIVVDESHKGQNIAHQLLEYAIHECQQNHIHSIRIDTHEDNLSMQRFLQKHGFHQCGEITLLSGDLRIGFEKILE